MRPPSRSCLRIAAAGGVVLVGGGGRGSGGGGAGARGAGGVGGGGRLGGLSGGGGGAGVGGARARAHGAACGGCSGRRTRPARVVGVDSTSRSSVDHRQPGALRDRGRPASRAPRAAGSGESIGFSAASALFASSGRRRRS